MMIRIFTALILLFSVITSAYAIDPFVVKDIKVEGIQRVSSGTIFNYLPVKVGDQINDEVAKEAIRALFATGQFEDVSLSSDGTTLIVTVKERPSIANVDISGNESLDDEDLYSSLQDLGLAQGRVLDPSVLDKVVQELQNQYFSVGKYAAEIESNVEPLSNNRVGIGLRIREGENAKIKRINIVGNKAFPEKELKEEFELSTKRRLLLFSPNDEYSRQQLQADLESLRDFYQDKGYLKFEITSTQVSISPDKQDIYVTVNLDEGDQYLVSDFSVKGRLVVPESELIELVEIKPGEVYSRRDVSASRKAISDRLGDDGYAFANVNSIPDINEQEKTVSFDLIIDPGRRVYVRRINISGNLVTRDEVVRREMRQLEGGWYSARQLQRSKVRLDRLGFFDEVKIDTREVPGSPDQVDIDVQVTERSTGSLLLGVGFSDADGVLFQAAVSQNNLFGTGREINITVDNSAVTDRIQLEYLNPYYTINGISRGFTVFRREVDAAEADTAEYVTDTLGAGVNYRFPLSEFASFNIGATAERVDLEDTPETPQEFLDFIQENESSDILKLTGNFSYDTRDSILFPTGGSIQRLSWEIASPPSDLEYFKLTFQTDWYWSLSDFLILKAGGELGYGDGYGNQDELPFFKNFFAGGATTVRGYDARSLGPRDSGDTPEALGGDRRILTNLEIQIPLPGEGGQDKRFSLFIDGGQVYGSGDNLDLGEIRYSAGIAFNWFSPLGPLALSYAEPLNDESGDDIERLQFTLGRFFQ